MEYCYNCGKEVETDFIWNLKDKDENFYYSEDVDDSPDLEWIEIKICGICGSWL